MSGASLKGLEPVLAWLRTTDLVEAAWRGPSASFDLRLEGAPPADPPPFPAPAFTAVRSPAVGLFRWGPPGAPRAAVEGAGIEEGAVLGVVDTGKRRIEVRAPLGGRVGKTIIQESSPVEYGQPLMPITP